MSLEEDPQELALNTVSCGMSVIGKGEETTLKAILQLDAQNSAMACIMLAEEYELSGLNVTSF